MSGQTVEVRLHNALGRGQWMEIEIRDEDGRPISRQTVWGDTIEVTDGRDPR